MQADTAPGEAHVVTPLRQGPSPCVQATSGLQGVTHIPLPHTVPVAQPPRESSAPTSAHIDGAVGLAQVVAPFRQGLIPSVQGTLMAHGGPQAPPLQTLVPVQPPLSSSAPMSAQAGALVGVAQVVAPWRHGPMPWVHGRLATHSVGGVPSVSVGASGVTGPSVDGSFASPVDPPGPPLLPPVPYAPEPDPPPPRASELAASLGRVVSGGTGPSLRME
jgi:hypothetical protein